MFIRWQKFVRSRAGSQSRASRPCCSRRCASTASRDRSTSPSSPALRQASSTTSARAAASGVTRENGSTVSATDHASRPQQDRSRTGAAHAADHASGGCRIGTAFRKAERVGRTMTCGEQVSNWDTVMITPKQNWPTRISAAALDSCRCSNSSSLICASFRARYICSWSCPACAGCGCLRAG